MSFFDSIGTRVDGWINAITGLGVAGRDRRTAGTFGLAPRLDRVELEEMYRGDALAAKIVDRLPNDMTRKGWNLKIEGDAELAQAIEDAGRVLDLQAQANTVIKWSRLHGGAAWILGIDDGQAADMPVIPARVRALRFITVLDRWQMSVATRYTDSTNPKFGQVELYRLSPSTATAGNVSGGMLVHETRVIPFVGVPLPARATLEQDGWGDSVLPRVYNALRGYHSAHDSVGTIISDFTQSVYKIKGLAGLTMDAKGEAALKSRMQTVDYSRSLIRAIMIDAENEEFSKLSTPVTGLPDLVDRTERRLVAESDMPHTLLLGESPGASLGEKGQSQKEDWHDLVSAMQQAQLHARLMRVYELLAIASEGPAKGQVPKGMTLTFCPLKASDPVQEAARRKATADADAIYMDRGALSPEEVADSRFGGDEWSPETTLKPGTLRERPKVEAIAPGEDPEDEDTPEDEPADDKPPGTRADRDDRPKKKDPVKPHTPW